MSLTLIVIWTYFLEGIFLISQYSIFGKTGESTFTATFSDATNGVVKLTLTDNQTDAVKRGRYFYDVVLTLESKASADADSDLQTVRLAQGGVVIVW